MLVLQREIGERIVIGDGPAAVVIEVVDIRGARRVRLGIRAPADMPIYRGERIGGPASPAAVATAPQPRRATQGEAANWKARGPRFGGAAPDRVDSG